MNNLITIKVLKPIAFPAVEILSDSILKVNLIRKEELGIRIKLGEHSHFIFNDRFEILS